MTIPHLKERIEYARDELAWLEKGAPEGEEPWRGWEVKHSTLDSWVPLCGPVEWPDYAFYRRRPAMLHIIDAKGKRHEFPEPMREAPRTGERYYFVDVMQPSIDADTWNDMGLDHISLAAGLCQSTEEGAQMQLAALRAVCLGGDV